jgi:hypothetical protein
VALNKHTGILPIAPLLNPSAPLTCTGTCTRDLGEDEVIALVRAPIAGTLPHTACCCVGILVQTIPAGGFLHLGTGYPMSAVYQ